MENLNANCGHQEQNDGRDVRNREKVSGRADKMVFDDTAAHK